jgi:homoserine kinase
MPAKKKTAPIKIIVPKAKTGIKRPSDIELSLTKPMKKTRKFALDSTAVSTSGLGSAGASSSCALAAAVKKATAPDKALWINMISMLERHHRGNRRNHCLTN